MLNMSARAALVLFAFCLSAPAQSQAPESKAAFILEVAGFGANLERAKLLVRSSVLEVALENDKKRKKLTSAGAERFAKMVEEEFAASVPVLKRLAARNLMNQLTPNELDALYNFYRTPLGLSASTKLHWNLENQWPAIVPQILPVLWSLVRERLAQDAELRHLLEP